MILITGATGFVGSYLVPQLVTQVLPSRITVLVPRADAVRAAGGKMDEQTLIERHRSMGVAIQYYPGTGSIEDYREAFKNIDAIEAVIYMAANNNQTAGFPILREHNVAVLERFVDALGGRLKGAHFFLTSSVMAAVSERFEGTMKPNTLEKMLPYGRSKQLAERVLTAKAAEYGFSPLVLRLGSVYGDRAATGLLKAVDGLMGLSMMAPIPYFPGRASVIHVVDVVRLLSDFAARPRGSGIYHCDDTAPVPVGELVRQAANKSGKKARLLKIPGILVAPLAGLLRFGVGLGIPACLGPLALFDDLYVTDDTRVWDL
jgi:nucleoside-diphosphate-sugar epimerase